MRCRDERHSRKKSKTSNCGHRPFRGTCRGNRPQRRSRQKPAPPPVRPFRRRAPPTAIRAPRRQKTRPPQKKKRMQPCRKRSKPRGRKDAASPEKIARFNDDIARFQELRDKMAAQAAELRESLPTMQADIDAAQAKYDEAINRVNELQAKLDMKLEELKAVEALGDEELAETIKQQIKSLRQEIVTAKARVDFAKWSSARSRTASKGRKDKLMTVNVLQRSIKPIPTSSWPGEMRSSTI